MSDVETYPGWTAEGKDSGDPVEEAEASLDELRAQQRGDAESPWLEAALERDRQLVQPTPVVSLLLKLDAWLMQQPEFFAILQAPRATRRQAITLIAKHITTFPARGKPFGGFGG